MGNQASGGNEHADDGDSARDKRRRMHAFSPVECDNSSDNKQRFRGSQLACHPQRAVR
jgi:hypothetical protein